MAKNKQFSNVQVHIFNQENRTINVESVIDIYADQIETESGVYPIENSQKYVDDQSGLIIYTFHADIPAKVEASQLKSLRRSNALARIFDYDVKKPVDLMKYIPYIIICLLIFFK